VLNYGIKFEKELRSIWNHIYQLQKGIGLYKSGDLHYPIKLFLVKYLAIRPGKKELNKSSFYFFHLTIVFGRYKLK